jgi:hypothetical protein
MLRRIAMALGVLAVGAPIGCVINTDDGEKFREPLPVTSEMSLSLPRSDDKAARRTQAVGPNGAAPSYAKFYQFTRDVTDGVDVVTGVILGSVWLVVHTRPTSISDHQATWGPGSGDALSPVVWRLQVTEVEQGVFDYQLDGRPKGSTDDGAYLAVLKGRGYGRAHAEHKNGWFVVDHDAARTLDPARAHDQGTAKITHQLRAWPKTIGVELRPTPSPDWLDIQVTHRADGAGDVDVNGLADIDAVKDGRSEDVVIHSRWANSGAGRADVQIVGGSVGTLVKASECWSTTFVRSYYTDNIGLEPTVGDSTACAFDVAKF